MNVAKWILAACLVATVGLAGEDWLTDYEKALKIAEKEDKTVLLDFSGSDWCGWCIKLDKEVFSKEAFKEYAGENLVTVLVDFPREKKQSDEVKKQNRELQKKFGIRGFPTVILLNSEGEKIAQTGYKRGGAEKYVEHLKKLIEKGS
jgi:thioredoxin-related protein